MPRTALLAGATGLVGAHCLERLLAHDAYAEVITLGRRPLVRSHPKLTHHVVDFETLEDHAAAIRGDDIFCCLGTTRKQAGSKEAFRRVDHDYPLQIAALALRNGATHYLLVSATGANPSSLFFYNRVKGEVEAALRALDYPTVSVMHPSLLTGDRDEKRTGEQVAEWLLDVFSFALRGPLARLRPTPADDVAAAMLAAAEAPTPGFHIYEPEAIRRLAQEV